MDQSVTAFDVFESRWKASFAQPATGSVRALVLRTGDGAHATPPRIELSPEGGVHGDRWSDGKKANPEAQVSLIDRRVVESLVDGDPTRLHVPGDNVVVDLDLDESSLPVGTRLMLGTAVVEISPKPHTGCAKFRARLGDDALLWINAPAHAHRRLRGVYARVVVAGAVAIGDRIKRTAD